MPKRCSLTLAACAGGRLSVLVATALALICFEFTTSVVAEESPPADATAPVNVAVAAPLPSPDVAAQLSYEQHIQPLMTRLCAECHSGDNADAGIALERLEERHAQTIDRAIWKKILTQLEAGIMPPLDATPQATAEERALLVAWVRDRALTVACNGDAFPGRVTLRRLNRAEYNNTIRDLLGVSVRPADRFPKDDVGYGFDNIGDVLTLPPVLLERYLDAAEIAVRAAIKVSDEDFADRQDYKVDHYVQSHDVTVKLPVEAEYVLEVQAWADQAGEEVAKAQLLLGERDLGTVDVPAASHKPEVYTIRAQLPAGEQKLTIRFTNDYYQPEHPDPKLRGDRNLYVTRLGLIGPLGALPAELPESHTRLVRVVPAKDATREQQLDAARQNLEPFVARAYRRTPRDGEVDGLLTFVGLVLDDGGSFERAMQVAVQAALVSPNFLFRIEAEPEDADPLAIRTLDSDELASRLSYFVWSSMPDDELLAVARTGELTRPEVLEAQTRRLLADPKSGALVENFAGQWLQLRNLEKTSPDPRRYRQFNEDLRQAMRRETELLFETILKEQRSLFDLLAADFTFVNEPLAKLYGMEGIAGPEFQRVSLDASRRGGLLGHASILTVTSNPTRTSPVKRGKWILENLLGATPPPAPPGVPALPERRREGDGERLTLRERLEKHRADPACASCHKLLDPLGFGLENYNAIGAWRDQDGDSPVDSSGELPDGRVFRGPAELRAILLERRAEFRRCLTDRLLTYALGRGLEYFDDCTVRTICDQTEAAGDRLTDLVVAIVQSTPFRQRARFARPDLATIATNDAP